MSSIQNANSNLPSGVLQGAARNFTVKSSGKLENAQNFNEMIVAYKDGMPVRLSDIGSAREVFDGLSSRLAQAVRASISVPLVFPPEEIDGRLLVDGGLSAVHHGA